MRTASNVNSIDTWSWVHLFGCAFLVFAFREMGLGLLSSCVATFGLGIVYEMLDESWKWIVIMYLASNKTYFLDRVFDRRGFSWLDLVFDAGGIALSVAVILM